jgi:hypothetical protein
MELLENVVNAQTSGASALWLKQFDAMTIILNLKTIRVPNLGQWNTTSER